MGCYYHLRWICFFLSLADFKRRSSVGFWGDGIFFDLVGEGSLIGRGSLSAVVESEPEEMSTEAFELLWELSSIVDSSSDFST